MRSTGLGEKLNVEGFKRDRGNHARPRAEESHAQRLSSLYLQHFFRWTVTAQLVMEG